MDSGTSAHFADDLNNFVKYIEHSELQYLQTVNGKTLIQGEGTIVIHFEDYTICLSPVVYMPHCEIKLISMCLLFKDYCLTINGGPVHIDFYDKHTKNYVIPFTWLRHYICIGYEHLLFIHTPHNLWPL